MATDESNTAAAWRGRTYALIEEREAALRRAEAAESELARMQPVVEAAVRWGQYLEPETSFEDACDQADEALEAEQEMCAAIVAFRASAAPVEPRKEERHG